MKLMKGLLCSLLLLPLAALAAPFEEDTHYKVIHQGPATEVPEITEFFSFACPHCRTFEPFVKDMIASKPDGVVFNRSHVDFVGGKQLGPALSQGWAVAELLKVEDQVKEPMFAAVQDKRSIRDADDVRDVFIDAGVSAEQYDNALNSFMLNGRVAQMRKAAVDKQIRGVPTFVVNGKYQVITQSLTSAQQLNDLVFWLATEKR